MNEKQNENREPEELEDVDGHCLAFKADLPGRTDTDGRRFVPYVPEGEDTEGHVQPPRDLDIERS